MEDRKYLEALANERAEDGDPAEAERLREVAARIANPPVEVVEQGTLMRKGASVPDGWSWADVKVSSGYFSGIRLQKGEPIVEQRGHLLLVRQAETSFEGRQVSIYERLSSLTWEGETGKGTLSVLVVFGFQGERHGAVWFRGGEQFPVRLLDEVTSLSDEVRGWLEWAVKNAAEKDDRHFRKGPRQTALSGFDDE